jgi:hypothetical protein
MARKARKADGSYARTIVRLTYELTTIGSRLKGASIQATAFGFGLWRW